MTSGNQTGLQRWSLDLSGKLAKWFMQVAMGGINKCSHPSHVTSQQTDVCRQMGFVRDCNRMVLETGLGFHPRTQQKWCVQVAMGFIKVANETMCRPIRALTQMKGYDVAAHALACFGGAGGQHACAIARALGMRTIFVHRYSGILSAVGIGLADVVAEEQV